MWVSPGAPPLFSFSLFLGEKPQNFYETPPGRGSVGPLYLPLPHLSPCWNKKRTKPQNWGGTWVSFSGGWGWEVNGRFQTLGVCGEQEEIYTLATLGNARNMQVSSGPSSRPLSIDLLSGQKEAATETLGQMERRRIWKGGDTERKDTERMKPDGAGGWESLGTVGVKVWGGS